MIGALIIASYPLWLLALIGVDCALGYPLREALTSPEAPSREGER